MATTIFASSMSLDGYIAAPSGELVLPVPEAPLHRHFNRLMEATAVAVYGRRLYELMHYWDTDDNAWPPEAWEFAQAWRDTPKVVCSTTLREVGLNARLVSVDAAGTLKRLKAETDGLILVGGAEFAASMASHGLIDEYHLYLQPVVLGEGKPFFAGGKAMTLRPLGQELLPQGVVLARYAPA